ncbi:CoA pyrophosphatase [Rheinheimera baltica]|uniref:CoA pyrophosphatase n=1 Tax=Rheinheimera baltica TaxID=67576 RepID=A0ABT9HTZ3_9GAMM|nr:CoA pyrophosphatase [Rheinheimera baltica]MDP5134594.1 CoA pyrophosphatase [Rheinheimera baltica]
MQVAEFRYRFLLQPAAKAGSIPSTDEQQAAVLVPVIDYGDKLHILFTQRALHLRHHPGQISFPGGRIELNELSADAALREANEEIGLLPTEVELLGRLPMQATSTGFTIQPWVGLLKPQRSWKLQADEVAGIFEVPLTHFLAQENRHQFSLPLRGKLQHLHAMPYQDKFIWGATAAILHRLCLQLAADRS